MSQYQFKNYTKKVGFLDIVWYYKYHLAFYMVGISFFTFIALYSLNIVPDELRMEDSPTDTVLASETATTPIPFIGSSKTNLAATSDTSVDLPKRVIISKIGVDVAVSNPTTTDNDILNQYLLKGAVRYPGSATLGKGNVFIFGHSTGIKIVNNQAFKAFNNLKNLNIDDQIQVQSGTKEYIYKVVSVAMADSDKALVDLSSTENMLTLSTCNVFGQKQQRFIVQAVFVSSHSI